MRVHVSLTLLLVACCLSLARSQDEFFTSGSSEDDCNVGYKFRLRGITQLADGSLVSNSTAGSDVFFTLESSYLQDQEERYCYLNSSNQLLCSASPNGNDESFCTIDNTLSFEGTNAWFLCPSSNGYYVSRTKANINCEISALILERYELSCSPSHPSYFTIESVGQLSDGQLRYNLSPSSSISYYLNLTGGALYDQAGRQCHISSDTQFICEDSISDPYASQFCISNGSLFYANQSHWYQCLIEDGSNSANIYTSLFSSCSNIPRLVIQDTDTSVHLHDLSSSSVDFCNDFVVKASATNAAYYIWTVTPSITNFNPSTSNGATLVVPQNLLLPGNFTFSVTAKDKFGVSEETEMSVVWAVPAFTAVVGGLSETSTISRSLLIQLDVITPLCNIAGAQYQWTSNDSTTFPAGAVQEIAAFTLHSPSFFILSLNLADRYGQIYSPPSTVAVTVIARPPMMLISQGSQLRSGTSQALYLDASSSIDYEELGLDSSTISFSWKCSGTNCPDLSSAKSSSLTVAAGQLSAGSYNFTVVGASGVSSSLTSSASIIVVVVAGVVPMVPVVPVPTQNSDQKITLEAQTASTNYTYQWSISGVTSQSGNVATPLDGSTLVLTPGALSSCSQYPVTLTVTDKVTGAQGQSQYIVSTACPPYGGGVSFIPAITSNSSFSQSYTVQTTTYRSRVLGTLSYSWVWWTDPAFPTPVDGDNRLSFTETFFSTNGVNKVTIQLTVSDLEQGVNVTQYTISLLPYVPTTLTCNANMTSASDVARMLSYLSQPSLIATLSADVERCIRTTASSAMSNLVAANPASLTTAQVTQVASLLELLVTGKTTLTPDVLQQTQNTLVNVLQAQIAMGMPLPARVIDAALNVLSATIAGASFSSGNKRSTSLGPYQAVDTIMSAMLSGMACGETITPRSNSVMSLKAFYNTNPVASVTSTGVFDASSASPSFTDGSCRQVKFGLFEYDIQGPKIVPSLYNLNSTRVYSIQIVGQTVAGLTSPVKLSVAIPNSDMYYGPSDLFCATRQDSTAPWTHDAGCNVTDVSSTTVTLVTNHFTQFTVYRQNLYNPPSSAFNILTEFYYHTRYNVSLNSADFAQALGTALGVPAFRFFVRSQSLNPDGTCFFDVVITDPYQNRGNNSKDIFSQVANAVSQNPGILSAQNIPATDYVTSVSVAQSYQPTFIPFGPVLVKTESPALFTVNWSFPTYTSYCQALGLNFQRWETASSSDVICRTPAEQDRTVECVALPGQTLNMSLTLVCSSLESGAITSSPYYVTVLRAAAPLSPTVATSTSGVVLSWSSGGFDCVDAASSFAYWSITVVTGNTTTSFQDAAFSPFAYTLPGGLQPGKTSTITISQVCTAVIKSSLAATTTFTSPASGNVVGAPTQVVAGLDDQLDAGIIVLTITTNAISCDFIQSSFSKYIIQASNSSAVDSSVTCTIGSSPESVTCQVQPAQTYTFTVAVQCADRTTSNATTSNSITSLSSTMKVATFSQLASNSSALSQGGRYLAITAPTSSFNSSLQAVGLGAAWLDISSLPTNTPTDYASVPLAFELSPVTKSGLAESSQLSGPVLLSFNYNDFGLTYENATQLVLYFYDESSSTYRQAGSTCSPSLRINQVDNTTQTWTVNTCHMTTFRSFMAPPAVVTTPGSNAGDSVGTTDTNRSSGLSGGAIAGIVLGSIFAIVIIVVLVVLLMNRKKTDKDGLFEPNHMAGPTRSPLFEPNHVAGVANAPETIRTRREAELSE